MRHSVRAGLGLVLALLTTAAPAGAAYAGTTGGSPGTPEPQVRAVSGPAPGAVTGLAAGAPFKLPYPAGQRYTVTQTPGSGYSHNDDYNRHAVDFAMGTGTAIVASAGGTVHYAGWTDGGGGNQVLINHGNNRCTQYAHLSSVSVRAGARVAQGQRIASSGATGNVTGPHLHWNVVHCSSFLSREIPNTVETGTSYPTGSAPLSQNRPGSSTRPDLERVSDWSGDGKADVLGVDSGGKLWYYPHTGNALSSPVQLGHGWGSFRHVMAADWSGDGKADILGVDSGGKLWYYPHTGNRLGARKEIGHGWGSFRHVMAADWSGDGKADVLGVDAQGRLWYYPHSGNGFGARKQIGHGWQGFRHVKAADWSGDGKADVIGVDSGGKLWYYPHNGNALSPPVEIGHGWGSFRHVMASDWSGDGHADVLGVDSGGKLWYYPHSGKGFGPRKQLGHGWGSFRFVM
ncbi:FG-GAP-like repeat-containing protein [Streptomyces albidoflavus]|uniref:FG-GAP-like repeat-containing protein n=1 Tax=Streptomyces albidoflavus TaxID=1886 RepID=UPI0033323586